MSQPMADDAPFSEQPVTPDDNGEEEADDELAPSDFVGAYQLPPEFAGGVSPQDFVAWLQRTQKDSKP